MLESHMLQREETDNKMLKIEQERGDSERDQKHSEQEHLRRGNELYLAV